MILAVSVVVSTLKNSSSPSLSLRRHFCFRNRLVPNGCRMTAATVANKEDDCGVDKEGPLVIEEGKARISFADKVFYNPVQEFNRDMSIAVIQQYVDEMWPGRLDNEGAQEPHDREARKFKILEALSATGLRSIRYAKEIRWGGGRMGKVVANDWSKAAVESIRKNVVENGVDHLVEPSHSDATMVMYRNRKREDRFDVVDLDPYGSPTPFLDGAVQSVSEGGLLCVTCTDLAVLAGNSPETCHAKYGAVSLKSKSCHEMALRIVLQCIEAHANRYGRHIVPLVSISVDFYVRIFVTVHTSQAQCKRTISKLGHVYRCNGCETQWVQPLGLLLQSADQVNCVKFKLPTGPPMDSLCKYCGHRFTMGGPFWLAPIHDPEFVRGLCESLAKDAASSSIRFNTMDRMVGMLNVIGEELHDVPFYYDQDRLCSLLKCPTGKMTTLRSGFLNAGYRVSLSHAAKLALKTDAPNDFIWRVMREWRRRKGRPEPNLELKAADDDLEGLQPDSVAHRIMSLDESKFLPAADDDDDDVNRARSAVDFTEHPEANPESRRVKMRRFQVNPPNWGPRVRATTVSKEGLQIDKRAKNQGKHKNKQVATGQDGLGGEAATKRPRSDPQSDQPEKP